MKSSAYALAVAALVAMEGFSDDLDATAERIERELELQFLDANGVLRCSSGASDVTIWESKGPYENVGIVNGTYLRAMCAKYAVTGDRRDLGKARRAYRAIAQVYELSQAMGEGYFCKPWEWKCQDETSSDQFVYAMLGMDAYYPLATDAERKDIAERIPKMARWWIRRGYEYKYLGRPLKWQRCRFPTFAALAEKYAKTGEFAAELKRLLSDPAVTNDMPYRCSIERGAFQAPGGKTYYEVSPGTAEIGFGAVSAVLAEDRAEPYANAVMRSCYELAKTCIAADGTAIVYVERLPDGSWREMPASAAFMDPPSKEDTRYNSPLLLFHGPVRVSAAVAVLGMVLMAEYYPPAAAWVDENAESIFAAMASAGFESKDPQGVRPQVVSEMVKRFPKHCEATVAWLQGYWTWRLRCKRAAEVHPLVPYPARLEPGVGVSRAPVAAVRDAALPEEGYRLVVSPEKIEIASSTAAGECYARQTLRQLRLGDGSYPCVTIEDAPRFKWRGVLIDDSRHFMGKDVVKRVLDQMVRFKLNVLHWHLVDSHGWRLQIDRHPELTAQGATRPIPDWDWNVRDAEAVGTYGPYFYTKDDVREILAYAAERHIRVVPEIEIPGHSREVILCHHDFTCLEWSRFADKIRDADTVDAAAALCVGNDDVVRFLEEVLDEVCELFPGEYVHIGGDECPRTNWKDCPRCQKRIRDNGLAGEDGLQTWITRHFADYLAKKGKKAIGWEEILAADLPDGAAVMSWRGAHVGIAAANAGHEVVMCPVRNCYVDYPTGIKGDPCPYPRFCDRDVLSLRDVYDFDPCKGIPPEQHRFILGSETLNWTESTWRREDLEYKMWPRTAASAEVLWTGSDARSYEDFVRRMGVVRKDLVGAGVNCAPLDGETVRPPEKTTSLAATAKRFEALVETRLRDAHGVVRSCLDRKGNLPTGKNAGKSLYENASMVMGAYMSAMCQKYRTTGSMRDLEAARRTCAGIFAIYDMSRPGGEGFYCKPWDWKLTDETSSDPYVYAMVGMDSYYPLGTAAERARIRDMIPKMARWWKSRDYCYKYFGHKWNWQRCRFVSFMTLAEKYAGTGEFAAERDRLLADPKVVADVPFKASLSCDPREMPDGGMIYVVNCETVISGLLSVWGAFDLPPVRRWIGEFRDLAIAGLAPDGSSYRALVKNADGTYSEMDPKRTFVRPEENKPPWNGLLHRMEGPYRHGGQMSGAALNALVQMAPYDEASRKWVEAHAEEMLARVADGHLGSYEDPHRLFPEEMRAKFRNIIRGEAMANWLWAYWTLRARKAEGCASAR